FVQLLHGVRRPEAQAVGHWTSGDVAAHVCEVTTLNRVFALGDAPPEAFREVYEQATTATVDQVSDLNASALRVLTERPPQVLARRIDEQVAQLLHGTAGSDGDEPISWLGGVKVPLKAVLGHTLS